LYTYNIVHFYFINVIKINCFKKHISLSKIKELLKEDRKIVFIGNKVYDFTNFDHPGNFNAFVNRLGKDVSVDYNFHGKKSKKIWKTYFIGYQKN
tara:strand:- start:1860 stop:2144 length:285 start_codon:yes stop_codon:yes gene_type:complete